MSLTCSFLSKLTPELIANSVDLSHFERCIEKFIPLRSYHSYFFDRPGREHYALLAYLSHLVQDAHIIDIGTLYGGSALALSHHFSNRVTSYDIARHHTFPGVWGAIDFIQANVLEAGIGQADFKVLLKKTPLVVIDVDPHDGVQEARFVELLVESAYTGCVIFDDIHLNLPMELFWAELKLPKFDLTPCGHTSGTGCVFFGAETNY